MRWKVLSCLQQLRVCQSKLLDHLGAGGLDGRRLAQEGDALVIVHLHDLVRILLSGDWLSCLRELELLDPELLQGDSVVHEPAQTCQSSLPDIGSPHVSVQHTHPAV